MSFGVRRQRRRFSSVQPKIRISFRRVQRSKAGALLPQSKCFLQCAGNDGALVQLDWMRADPAFSLTILNTSGYKSGLWFGRASSSSSPA